VNVGVGPARTGMKVNQNADTSSIETGTERCDRRPGRGIHGRCSIKGSGDTVGGTKSEIANGEADGSTMKSLGKVGDIAVRERCRIMISPCINSCGKA
jgi:hypothetical protein